MNLKTLLQRIAMQRKEEFPFPEDIESYLEDFVPNILAKSDSLQQAFGITSYEMEKLYEEAFNHYEKERYHESLYLFRFLLLFNSYEEKYWMGYAAAQQLLGRFEKALQAYAVAALLDSGNPYPHYHAYACYKQMHEEIEAKKALAMCLELCLHSSGYDQLREELDGLCRMESLQPK